MWTAVDTLSQGVTIPSHGASAEAIDQNLGFYLGGQVDNGTANDTSSLVSPVPIPGMVVIDTTTNRVTNYTIPDFAISNRQDGGAIYISEYGEKGVLLALGGKSNGQVLNMSQIAVFDIATLNDTARSTNTATVNTWYTIQASGAIPNPREKFCMAAVRSQDNSSTNIYVYGGRSDNDFFDDVFVLSLPSFTWTQVFTGTTARYGMTCSFVPPRQMVISGGVGQSGNLTADCDWLNKGIGFLDMSEVHAGTGWTSNFDANAKPYELPVDVLNTIGGSSTGGATLTRPIAGWATPALEQLFSLRVTSTAGNGINTTSTNTPQSGGWTALSTAAKAGVVVGSTIAILLLVVLVFFVLKSRQKRRSEAKALIDSTRSELQAPREPQEVHALEKPRAEKDSAVVYEAPVETGFVEIFEAPEDAHYAREELHEAPSSYTDRNPITG